MKFVIITPSYGPDFERAELLANSVKDLVPAEVEHLLLVDRADVPRFQALGGPRTRVIEVESILPWWIRRVPGARRWWLSLKTLPIRNWILQQVVKLSVGECIDADNYLFVDSDVTFIRPFNPMEFLDRNNHLRLFRVPNAARKETHFRWHRTAARLLGLPSTDYFGSNYIGNIISWRRDVLTQLYRHIEETTGRDWKSATCSSLHLSEYILYGVFVEHVLQGAGHYYQHQAHCHISWDYDISTPTGLNHFISETRPEHVAVMVSSKDGISPKDYRESLSQIAHGSCSITA